MSINTNKIETGQKTAARSAPVVLAVDQPRTLADIQNQEILESILVELRVQSVLLQEAFSIRDSLESLRSDLNKGTI